MRAIDPLLVPAVRYALPQCAVNMLTDEHPRAGDTLLRSIHAALRLCHATARGCSTTTQLSDLAHSLPQASRVQSASEAGTCGRPHGLCRSKVRRCVRRKQHLYHSVMREQFYAIALQCDETSLTPWQTGSNSCSSIRSLMRLTLKSVCSDAIKPLSVTEVYFIK